MKRKLLIGCMIFLVSCLSWMQMGCSNNKTSKKSSSETEASSESTQSSYDCPHCNGTGERMNTITGEYTSCSSCGGDGKVTKEQYDRLSK